MLDPPKTGVLIPSDKFPEHEVIGQSLKATSRTASRSAACAAILCAGLFLFAPAKSAIAQVAPASASDTVRADTTNNLIVSSDTTKEVKHVVKKGDTLWDLAKFYLKDPFRWPEIFRRNTDVVENPHWIYPGEVIRIWGTEVKTAALAHADSAGEVVSHVAPRTTFTQTQAPTANVPGTRSDLTVFASPMSRAAAAAGASSDVIGRSRGGIHRGEIEAAPYAERGGGPRNPGRLMASADRPGIKTNIVRSRFQLNDEIYVELPEGSVARLGDTYMSYVLGPDLDEFGQVVIPTGMLLVESFTSGRRVLARLVRQFGEVLLDQDVIAAPNVTFPSGDISPVANGTAGRVLYVHEEPVLPSIGHYVIVSPNAKNRVQVGDEITFVDNTTGAGNDIAAPPVVAGVGQVVRATQYAATVIILRQEQPTIRDGMRVRVTAKTP